MAAEEDEAVGTPPQLAAKRQRIPLSISDSEDEEPLSIDNSEDEDQDEDWHSAHASPYTSSAQAPAGRSPEKAMANRLSAKAPANRLPAKAKASKRPAKAAHGTVPDNDVACDACGSPEQGYSMLLCDGCDAGWHMGCLKVGCQPCTTFQTQFRRHSLLNLDS